MKWMIYMVWFKRGPRGVAAAMSPRRSLGLVLSVVAVALSACSSAAPVISVTPASMAFGATETTKEGEVSITKGSVKVETQTTTGPFSVPVSCAGVTVTSTKPCKFTVKAEMAGTGELLTKVEGVSVSYKTTLSK